MLYRRKPVEVDVMGPLTPETRDEIAAWCHGRAEERPLPGPGRGLTQGVVIHTVAGDMRAAYGDYIIRGASGDVDVCKPDIFAATYEPIE